MLPDPWDRDIGVIWEALDAACGDPGREESVLRWLLHRSPGEWARLDIAERSGGYGRPPRFPSALPTTLTAGWRSFSADGHARESAVRALAADPHEASNGFLLLRCDDWVPAVRTRARDAVLARCRAGAFDLATWTPLILARDARSRSGRLAEACAASLPAPRVESLLAHPDRRTRRWATQRLLASAPDAADLARLVGRAADPMVARALAATLSTITDDAGLHGLLTDRRAGVRLAAWEQVQAGRLPGLDLSAGLRDRAPTIRARAQAVARTRGFAAGAVYLAAPQRSAAERRLRLLGLGEWGVPEAPEIAAAALSDPDTSVRVTAIAVLGQRLHDPGPVLLDLLGSTRGAELRAVRREILTRRVHVPDALLAALREGVSEQRLAAWQLGRAAGRWERLIAGLLALGDPDETLARGADADVATWCRQVGPEAGRPNAEQRRALELALARMPKDTPYLAYIGFVLRA